MKRPEYLLTIMIASMAAGCQLVIGIEDVTGGGGNDSETCVPAEPVAIAMSDPLEDIALARSGDVVVMGWRVSGNTMLSEYDSIGQSVSGPYLGFDDSYWDLRLTGSGNGAFAVITGNHAIAGQHHLYFSTWEPATQTISEQVRISEGEQESQDARLVWSDGEYGVAWRQGDHVAFGRLDAEGTVIERHDLPGATPNPTIRQAMWTGSDYAVLYSRDDVYELARFDRRGMPDGQVSSGVSSSVDALWDGDRYVVVTGSDDNISIAFLEETGEQLGLPMIIDDEIEARVRRVGVATSGRGYAVAWLESLDDEVYVATLDEDARVQGVQRLATPQNSFDLKILWTGHAYLVVWHRWGEDAVEMARICQ